MIKDRYVTLDAMRGIAALFVVYRHYSEIFGTIQTQFSFLAVDLFFVLSGFVLALRYDSGPGARLPVREFLIRRVIRLYPLFLVGMGLAIVRAVPQVLSGFMPPGTFVMASLTGLLILPSPTPGFTPAIIPLMGPGWSLFFELFVANLAFAFIRGRLSTPVLAALVAGAGAALAASGLFWGHLDLGPTWPTFLGGFPRVMFSFLAGMLLQRFHGRTERRGLPSWAILAALVALLLPSVPTWAAQPYQFALVFAALPALVYLGAGAFERRPALGLLLGDASYAVYAIHFPIVRLFAVVVARFGLTNSVPLAVMFVGGVTLLALALARYVDEPFRAIITRRRQRTS